MRDEHAEPQASGGQTDRRVRQLARGVPSGERRIWILGQRDGPRCHVRIRVVHGGARPGGASRRRLRRARSARRPARPRASTTLSSHVAGRRGESARDDAGQDGGRIARGLALGRAGSRDVGGGGGRDARADHGRARHDDRQRGAGHALAGAALATEQHSVGIDGLPAVAGSGDPLSPDRRPRSTQAGSIGSEPRSCVLV